MENKEIKQDLPNGDSSRISDYQAELDHAFANMESMLSQLQMSMGIVKSFMYLIKKESLGIKLNQQEGDKK